MRKAKGQKHVCLPSPATTVQQCHRISNEYIHKKPWAFARITIDALQQANVDVLQNSLGLNSVVKIKDAI